VSDAAEGLLAVARAIAAAVGRPRSCLSCLGCEGVRYVRGTRAPVELQPAASIVSIVDIRGAVAERPAALADTAALL